MSQADQEERPGSSLGGRQARVLTYHLPPCAIRRRHGEDEIFWSYRVQLERGKQQRWTATFSRWAKCMGDQYFRIGKVSFTAASVGSVFLCSHSAGFEPAEFCMDEVDGLIYMVKLNRATSVMTMFAQRLVIYEKLKLMQLVGVPVYFSSKPIELCAVLKCSHFSISDDDDAERRFVLALSTCPNSNELLLHRDWLCLLSRLDAKNKSLDCTLIVRSMDSSCNVFDPYGLSVWQRVDDKILGVAVCTHTETHADLSEELLPVKHFLVSFDGRVHDETQFFLAVKSSKAALRHRLIGLFGKYLLFHLDGRSVVRAVRVLTQMKHPYRRMDIELGPDHPENLDTSLLWLDANCKFYISGCCEESRISELSMWENPDSAKLLSESRQCATCGIFEQMKWLRTDGKRRMSSFKVCTICKEKKLHKEWWRFKCHFCSSHCFAVGWKNHKKIH